MYGQAGYVELIGHIWQPGIGPCAQRIELRAYDVENIGETVGRESVLDWLYLHTGDFQSIDDFSAVVGGVEIPWQDEDSEYVYNNCMYPSDEPCACGECSDCA